MANVALDRAWEYGAAGAGLGATLGSVIPGVGTAIGTGIGAAGGSLYGYLSGRGDDQAMAEEQQRRSLISGTVDPALLAAQNNQQGVYGQLLGSEAYSGLIGGTTDPLYDSILGSPEFQASLRGEVAPQQLELLQRQIGDQFSNIRSDVGANLARRGVGKGTIGGRQIANTYDSERQALGDALVRGSLQRQSMGYNVAGQASQNRLARLGLGYNLTSQIAGGNRQMAGLIAGNRLSRMGMGQNITAGRDAARAQIGHGAVSLIGSAFEHDLARDKLDMERNRGRTQYTRPIGPTTPRPAHYPAGQDRPQTGSKPTSLMKRPTSPMLRRNPSAGRSGFGQMRRRTGAQL